jgi:CHAT domain
VQTSLKIQGVQGVSIELTADGLLHYRRKFLFRKDDEAVALDDVAQMIFYPSQLGMRAIAEVVLIGSQPRGQLERLNLGVWCIAVDRNHQDELESFVQEVRSRIVARPDNEPNQQASILIAFAQPHTGHLASINVDNEAGDIQTEVSMNMRCSIVPAANPRSLTEAYVLENPALVHIASHGVAGGLIGETATGESQMLTDAFLVSLFQGQPNPNLKCVVLNACLSGRTVASIAPHVPAAIGLTNVVEDAVARQFAVAFYRQVLTGETFGRAFAIAQTIATATNASHALRYTFVGDHTLKL